LEVRRPADYANREIPIDERITVPRLNLTKVGLVSPFVDDVQNKIFIGGIPKDMEDEQLREMLSPYGQLKAFKVSRDPDELRSNGYAFCEYLNFDAAERTCLALNGTVISK
jgi:RNA recognition motif-containing protein